jgi:hypothetical protein
MKFVFPIVWIGGFALTTAGMFLEAMRDQQSAPLPPEMKWGFLGATLMGTMIIWWWCIRLKRVSLSGDSLVISNYVREITVPLHELRDVTENRWVNIHPVTLHFRSDTDFGQSVMFMPKARWFAFFSSHPIVGELRVAANLLPE